MGTSIAKDQYQVDVLITASRQALLAWYDENGRDLPWRVKGEGIANPYHVWLSEIMLQQTTVAHATQYFMKFIHKWPTIEDLASEDQNEVLANWAGLGYYARARNMLKCARYIVTHYGGHFPEDVTLLNALPGVGPYTAAAISSMALGQAANVVDGNIERIMSRLYAVETPLPLAKRELIDLASLWVRSDRARDWPQALMDLASLICRPTAPQCHECPLSNTCKAGGVDADSFPKRLPKTQKPKKYGDVFVITSGDSLWVERRPDTGLLGGMLGLPHSDWSLSKLKNNTKEHLLSNYDSELIGAYKHVFTHFELHQEVWYFNLYGDDIARFKANSTDGLFMSLSEIGDLPTVFKKAVKLFLNHKKT